MSLNTTTSISSQNSTHLHLPSIHREKSPKKGHLLKRAHMSEIDLFFQQQERLTSHPELYAFLAHINQKKNLYPLFKKVQDLSILHLLEQEYEDTEETHIFSLLSTNKIEIQLEALSSLHIETVRRLHLKASSLLTESPINWVYRTPERKKQIFNLYTIALINKGKTQATYLSWDRVNQRHVALRIPHKNDTSSFILSCKKANYIYAILKSKGHIPSSSLFYQIKQELDSEHYASMMTLANAGNLLNLDRPSLIANLPHLIDSMLSSYTSLAKKGIGLGDIKASNILVNQGQHRLSYNFQLADFEAASVCQDIRETLHTMLQQFLACSLEGNHETLLSIIKHNLSPQSDLPVGMPIELQNSHQNLKNYLKQICLVTVCLQHTFVDKIHYSQFVQENLRITLETLSQYTQDDSLTISHFVAENLIYRLQQADLKALASTIISSIISGEELIQTKQHLLTSQTYDFFIWKGVEEQNSFNICDIPDFESQLEEITSLLNSFIEHNQYTPYYSLMIQLVIMPYATSRKKEIECPLLLSLKQKVTSLKLRIKAALEEHPHYSTIYSSFVSSLHTHLKLACYEPSLNFKENILKEVASLAEHRFIKHHRRYEEILHENPFRQTTTYIEDNEILSSRYELFTHLCEFSKKHYGNQMRSVWDVLLDLLSGNILPSSSTFKLLKKISFFFN